MPLPQSKSFRFGRSVSDVAYGRRYIAEDVLLEGAIDKDLFFWFDASRWDFVPSFDNQTIAIVGNSKVRGQGACIDSFDEVVRLNSMKYWLRSPADDGVRATVWAGLPWACFVPCTDDNISCMDTTRIRFGEVAQEARLIWCTSPFYISAKFVDFLRKNNYMDKLFISGSGIYFYDYLMGRMPPEMFRSLFTIPNFVLPNSTPNYNFNFELLLTGIRVTLFCALAGATEIGLFGFSFYQGAQKRPWAAHDLAFNKQFLGFLKPVAARWGCKIRHF